MDHDPLEGTHKYKVIRELGRGGMGEVFLAEHVALGSRVVVKLLHAELSGRSTLVDRMRLEAQALARLNHPNIVRVTDFDRTPTGRPYFVMEYLPGHSLAEELDSRGGVLPPTEAIDIVRQALSGLATAHSKGLVHRDIKLDNLFVAETTSHDGTPARTIKILDFGVAKILDPTADGPAPLMIPTGTGVVVGTPRFFAPEQARGQRLDHRADIYAMGLVLYSLVAGRGPFDEATNITEMAKAHVLTPPQPPSRFAPQPIPPALDAAVLRAIQKRPEDRFQSAPEFSAELDRIARAAPAADSLAATRYEPPAITPPSDVPQGGHVAPTTPLGAMPQMPQVPQAHGPHGPHVPQPHVAQPHVPPAVRRYSAGVVIAVLVVASLLGAALAAAVMSMA